MIESVKSVIKVKNKNIIKADFFVILFCGFVW